jgi:biopolymer transport protein ExbD
MPLKSLPVEEPTLNLTPMVDIVFLLIIFFMVGTQFAEMERSIDVQLPTVSSVTPLTNLPDAKVIDIHDDGKIVYEGTEVTLEDLQGVLEKAKENYTGQAIVLRGDQRCAYQQIMNVIAVCKRAKISSISLANKPEKTQE